MSSPTVLLRLSPAQARCVNAALALLEAEGDDHPTPPDPDVLARTRRKVHEGLELAGVSP